MSNKNIFFVAMLFALGTIAAVAFVKFNAPGAVESPAVQSAPVIRPDSCTSLEQCGPGCYKGKRYSYKVCTAAVGSSTCSTMWSGEEICATPDYDPGLAYQETRRKEWEALTRGKK